MHLEIQRGSQADNNTYIIKNTDNYVSWTAPKENLRAKLKNEFSVLSTAELQDIRVSLINKLYANDKSMCEIELSLITIISEAYAKNNEFFDIRHRVLNDCIFYMQELKNKKEASRIIDKYL